MPRTGSACWRGRPGRSRPPGRRASAPSKLLAVWDELIETIRSHTQGALKAITAAMVRLHLVALLAWEGGSVVPATRSHAVLERVSAKALVDGLVAHSLRSLLNELSRSLLNELSTIVRNTCRREYVDFNPPLPD